MDYEQWSVSRAVGKGLVWVFGSGVFKPFYQRYFAFDYCIADHAHHWRGDYHAIQFCGDNPCAMVEWHQASICGYWPIKLLHWPWQNRGGDYTQDNGHHASALLWQAMRYKTHPGHCRQIWFESDIWCSPLFWRESEWQFDFEWRWYVNIEFSRHKGVQYCWRWGVDSERWGNQEASGLSEEFRFCWRNGSGGSRYQQQDGRNKICFWPFEFETSGRCYREASSGGSQISRSLKKCERHPIFWWHAWREAQL